MTENAQGCDEPAGTTDLAAGGSRFAPADEVDPAEDSAPPDLERRFLCADGTCIGVIGPDARCKVCGVAIAPDEVTAFEQALGVVLGAEFVRAAPVAVLAATREVLTDGSQEPEPDDELAPALDERVLCSDGACIGVIGADQRCKICGKASDVEESERG